MVVDLCSDIKHLDIVNNYSLRRRRRLRRRLLRVLLLRLRRLRLLLLFLLRLLLRFLRRRLRDRLLFTPSRKLLPPSKILSFIVATNSEINNYQTALCKASFWQ